MSANHPFDTPDRIWLPDQMETVETRWGPMERWRATALCVGEISNLITRAEQTRADDVAGASALSEETKPPDLAADTDEEPQPEPIDTDMLEAIEARIDELATRVDQLERRRAAEAALDALENEIATMYPGEDDDDEDMTPIPRRH